MKSSDIKEMKLNSNYFLINWHATRWCNYHCSYCFSPRSNIYTSEDDLISIAKDLNNFINNISQDKEIYIKLVGGEIGFYNWPLILNNIKRLNKLNMITNFSNSLDYYKNLYEYTKSRNIKFTLVCSKHKENLDYDDKIIELTIWCKEHNYTLPIYKVMVDDNFSISEYNKLIEKGLRISLSLIRDGNNKIIPLNNKENWEFMLNKFKLNKVNKKSYAKVLTNNEIFDVCNAVQFANSLDEGGFNPSEFLCSAGHNGIYIGPDGLAYRCGEWRILETFKGVAIENFKKYLDDNLELCPIKKEDNYFCTLCWYINLKRGKNDD